MFQNIDHLRQCLFSSVRATLETMAFSEVLLCSDSGAVEHIAQPFTERLTPDVADGWGAPVTEEQSPSISTVDSASATDAWGAAAAPVEAPAKEAEPMSPADAWGSPSDVAQGVPASSNVFDQAASVAIAPLNMGNDVFWSTVLIHAPEGDGHFYIAVPPILALQLAETMYAGTMDCTDDVMADMVAELANTIAGHLMLSLGEIVKGFVLGVPQRGRSEPRAMEGICICRCLVDGRMPVMAILEPRTK